MMNVILYIIIAIISCTIIIIIIFRNPTKSSSVRPPPGPNRLPFIGNLHQYDFTRPHVFWANLAKTHGPVVSLQLGCAPVVVVHSAELAKEVLKTRDLDFCGRPIMVGSRKLSYNGLDIAFCGYNGYFREIKKICVVHLFNSIRVKSFGPVLQEEISRLVDKISTVCSGSGSDSSLGLGLDCVDLSDLVHDSAYNYVCKTAIGRSYEDDEENSTKFRKLLQEMEVLFIDMAYSDYFPSFGWLDKLTGKSARLIKTFSELDTAYQRIIDDHIDPKKHKNNNNNGGDEEDFIDVLLQLRKERSFAFELTFDHVKAILMNIFVGGTDTSSTMIIWAMTELIKNPDTMKKVQGELRKNVPKNTSYITEDDLQNMEYFKAVVKETFRLHPASPLLVAHQAINKSKIDKYDIEPGTVVMVNAWAIGRDPVSWTDPDKFMPERFLGSSIDFKGHDFELIPFGSGRRMCPAVHFGTVSFELTLANLLYSFDWKLPGGVDKDDIDTDTVPGIAMHKRNHLCLRANKVL